MSEDRRYAGSSSLAPPDSLVGQEAPYQEPSPFRAGQQSSSSSFHGGQEAFYSNEASSSSSFLSPTSAEDLQLGESDIVKKKVASAAILQASGGRRKKAADFRCTWEQCNATFTAKHNLTSEYFFLIHELCLA